MYCQTCHCEYSGWANRCPVCKTMLQERKPDPYANAKTAIPYDQLVEQIEQQGGLLVFDLSTIQVRKKRSLRFPYRGFGFAWASRLQAELEDLPVDLYTTRVEEDRGWSFPYFGYGFAWEQEMEGHLNGQPLTLEASKIKRERQQAFPYRGYGFAWTEELAGSCGSRLEAVFRSTKVDRSRGYQFPYFGFGYAWIAQAELSLSLLEIPDG